MGRPIEWYEEYIKQHFTYHDGKLERDDRRNSNGSICSDGYLIIKVKKRQFKAHRIVWLLFHGHFPERELDHINRNKLDNRIENLREVSRRENNLNRDIEPNPETGVVGIYKDKTKGLKAVYAFQSQGKTYRFRTLEEAIERRKQCLES